MREYAGRFDYMPSVRKAAKITAPINATAIKTSKDSVMIRMALNS
jgi:hypothetical protein